MPLINILIHMICGKEKLAEILPPRMQSKGADALLVYAAVAIGQDHEADLYWRREINIPARGLVAFNPSYRG